MFRAIKGSATVKSNTKEEIFKSTRHLITEIISKNMLSQEDFCAIIFSSTKDLTAAYPSDGIDTLPFFSKNKIPMFDTQHKVIDDDDISMCIRVLFFVDVNKDYKELTNIAM